MFSHLDRVRRRRDARREARLRRGGIGIVANALRRSPQGESAPLISQAIDALPHGPRIKAGLKLILDGVPYRQAAAEAGLASHQDLHRTAKRLGLPHARSPRLVEGTRRIADLPNSGVERRLTDKPKRVDTKTSAIVSGISADKAARFVGWTQPPDENAIEVRPRKQDDPAAVRPTLPAVRLQEAE
jgi:hypothetical protein